MLLGTINLVLDRIARRASLAIIISIEYINVEKS